MSKEGIQRNWLINNHTVQFTSNNDNCAERNRKGNRSIEKSGKKARTNDKQEGKIKTKYM